MKRATLKILAAAASVTLLVAGCGKDDSGSGDSDKPTTLTISIWNYDKTPEFKALFTAFESKNPNIKIKPVDILADTYSDKLTAMLAGGDTTDVLTMKNVTDYARYGLRGQLQEISDLVKKLPTKQISGLDAFDLRGKYYAAPYRQDFWLLYYNKDIFDAAKLDYPKAMTWTEYAALAKKLTSESSGKKVYGTYHHEWRSVVQAIAAAQTGGDLLSGKYDFMKNQYDMALELQKSGNAMDWSTIKTQKISYRTVFENGTTAMLPMGTWYAASILQSQQEGKTNVNWGFAPMPQISTGGKTVTFGSPTAFAVNKKAKNSAAAKKFIQFAAGEEGAKAIASIGVTPAIQNDETSKTFFAMKGMPTDEASKKSFSPDKVVLEMPVSEQTSDIDRILKEEHELIMSGQKKVSDGISSMGSRVKSEVK